MLAMFAASASVSFAGPGADLFGGAAPLRGTIDGHSNPLPPHAARCINCHAVGSAGPSGSASASSFGPLLSPQRLTGLIARRGGPPSRYDGSSFCRLLRQGVDPAWVMVPRSMPRYELTDADCRALWLHLTSGEAARP